MLRKHQKDMAKIVDGIIEGSPVRDIIVKATPGSGKSSLPIIAGKLIPAGLADAICWICPRSSLQDQAERNFTDPFFRQMLNHNLTIRSATNDNNPCRGTNGFVTTYQAIGVDDRLTALSDFRRRRYILVLDEYHHAGDDGAWTKSLQPLYDAARYRVLMTGTLSRGDKKRIAFTPYMQTGDEFTPALDKSPNTAIIEYSRKDALADKAILPLNFVFLDGSAKWKTRSGRIIDTNLSTQFNTVATHALYTALNTEYAFELLAASVNHWRVWRKTKPSAKLLVVAANIKSAKEYTEALKRMGLNTRIATSENSQDAHDAIKAYKAGRIDVLASVGMAYEGLDVPSISHIACLTNIRSLEWIIQMAARGVRIDGAAGPYESQQAFVFAPKDRMFLELKAQIDSEQLAAAKVAGNNNQSNREPVNGELFPGMGAARTPGGIKPLSSRLFGMDLGKMPSSYSVPALPKTQKETESDLLNEIEEHIRIYAHNNRYNPKQLNGEVFAHFNKKRREMSIPELERCLAHVRSAYPLSFCRGTGRRVPTKATMLKNVAWR
jgi:superfamily II DNA or RNA helicase